MLARMWRKGKLLALLVGMQISAAIMENSMEIPQKTKNRSTIWLSHFWEYIQRKFSQHVKKIPALPCLLQLVHNNKDMESVISGWLDEEKVVYIHNGVLLSHKTEWNPDLCNKMYGIRDHYVKTNKPETDEYCMFSLICGNLYMCMDTLLFGIQIFTNVIFIELYPLYNNIPFCPHFMIFFMSPMLCNINISTLLSKNVCMYMDVLYTYEGNMVKY